MTGGGPLVGILGGMGPAATADFYDKLIRATPAETDQEHLRVVIWADPTVPDRTAALLDGGADPAPFMERGARALKEAGADLIAVPCNTAHAFLLGIGARLGVRIIHMIEETARHIEAMSPPVHRVGILATTGTVKARLYQDSLSRAGRSVVLPDAGEQAVIMRVIRDVKAGDTGPQVRRRISEITGALAARGAQAVVAGCTELPLVLHAETVPVPVADPARILADAVVAQARRIAGSGPSPNAPMCGPSGGCRRG
ncbi:aspartate/glutamate racemase family protein [Nonomuraea sp. NPDC049480]|uniref:aspartate/glutamate racemase family protein n=1 Tax=Nonomuraea sp. NPDC049480 TaxID=3364353 RepID=UPI0037A5D699